MRRYIYSPETIYKIPNIFGDGSDGNVVISSNTTLTSDMYYENLTINPGVRLITGGFRLFVRNRLTNKGIISWNGNNASGSSGAPALTSYSLLGGAAGGNAGGFVSNGSIGYNAIQSLGSHGGDGGDAGSSTGGYKGEALAISDVLGSVRNFIGALTGRSLGRLNYIPTFRVKLNNPFTLTSGVETKIQWDYIQYDNTDQLDLGMNNTDFYILFPGVYLITVYVVFAGNSTGYRYISVPVNSDNNYTQRSTQYAVSSNFMELQLNTTAKFNNGDTIYVKAYQNSGGNLNISPAGYGGYVSNFKFTLVSSTAYDFMGGAGGGGGASSSPFGYGGGGGGGGGVVLIGANILDNSEGTIEAKGGNGANALNSDCGGGGGGGGGAIILTYNKGITGDLNVSGGQGGSGLGSGQNGENGSEGGIYEIKAI